MIRRFTAPRRLNTDHCSLRYIDTARLRRYKMFKIQPVQVQVKSFEGKPIMAEEKMVLSR